MFSIYCRLKGAVFLALLTALPATGTWVPDQAEEKSDKITPKMLNDLLGKDHRSPEVMALPRALKTDPTAAYIESLGEVLYYNTWKDKGVVLSFAGKNQVKAVFLYDGSDARYGKYDHDLPAKLSFKDSIETVKKELGEPENTGEGIEGKIDLPAHLDYDSKGISVCFDAREYATGKATVHHIILYQPKKAAPD